VSYKLMGAKKNTLLNKMRQTDMKFKQNNAVLNLWLCQVGPLSPRHGTSSGWE
jgi:hypothetical protein